MKNKITILTLITSILLTNPIIAQGKSSETPTIRKIISEPLNDDTDKKTILELINFLDSLKSNSKYKSNLALLAKAFLYYRYGNYKKALEITKNIGAFDINDLKYFIIADSFKEISLNKKADTEPKKIFNSLKNSINYFTKIVLDYKKSPLFDKAQSNLLITKLLLADNYLDNGNYSIAINIYLKVLLNHSKDLTKDQYYRLYFKLGDAYYIKKYYSKAKNAYLIAKKGNPNQKILEKKLMRISSLIKEQNKDFDLEEDESLQQFIRITLDSGDLGLEKSKEEKSYSDAKGYYENENYKKAIISLSLFDQQYPGSKYSNSVKSMILKAGRGLLENAKKTYPWGKHYKALILDKETIKAIGRINIETQIKLSSIFYRSEFLKDTGKILQSIIKNDPKSDFAPRAHLLLARIYRTYKDYDKAILNLKILNEKYSNSSLSDYAFFKTGLIYFEMSKFTDAVKFFSKYTERNPENKPEGLWWLAKSWEKLGDEKKQKKLHDLLRKYMPLSFYAVIESSYSHLLNIMSSNKFDFKKDYSSVKKLLSFQKQIHLKRAFDFISIGMFDFADHELQYLKDSSDKNIKLFLAWIFQDIGFPRKAIAQASSSLRNRSKGIDAGLIKILFPKEYLKLLIKESELYGIDHILLLSLIKQESAFDNEAVSRSGAKGLMQLMPFTADEVANRFLIPGSVPAQSLYSPEVNVNLATYYIYNLLKRLDGNIIYSLASYNAGPARCKEWINQNGHLSDMEFIEQIPVGETNGYVKNILRNYIVYSHIIDKKIISLKEIKNAGYYKSLKVVP